MALIYPVYKPVRAVTLSTYDFTGTNPTAIGSTSNPVAARDLGAATKPLPGGLLCGISVTLQANTGSAASTYKVTIFNSSSATLTSGTAFELYSASFAFSAVGKTLSDMLDTPIPFFDQPHIQIAQTTTALNSNSLLVNVFVQSATQSL